jgi:transposase
MAVEAYYNSGQSLEDVAKICGVAKNTLYNWVKRERANESFEDRPRSGKPRKLNEKHMDRLIELTQQHPDWTQQRFVDQMNREFEGLGLKQPCLCVTLKRARISLKETMER